MFDKEAFKRWLQTCDPDKRFRTQDAISCPLACWLNIGTGGVAYHRVTRNQITLHPNYSGGRELLGQYDTPSWAKMFIDMADNSTKTISPLRAVRLLDEYVR